MPDHGIAVFELAGIVDVDGNGGEFLHHVLAGHAGMTAGTGSDNVDAPQSAQFIARDAYVVEVNASLGQRDARLDRAAQSIGLLEDFANQMMREFARFSHCILNSVLLYGNSVLLYGRCCLGSQLPRLRARLVRAFNATDESSQHFTFRTENDEVCISSRDERALVCDPGSARGISGRGGDGLRQAPLGKIRKIAHGTIQGQNASGECAVGCAFAIVELHLERSKAVRAVWHAGR